MLCTTMVYTLTTIQLNYSSYKSAMKKKKKKKSENHILLIYKLLWIKASAK